MAIIVMNTIEHKKWECLAKTFHSGRTEIGGTKFVIKNVLSRFILTWREQGMAHFEHVELTSEEWDGLFDDDAHEFQGYLMGAEPGYVGNYPERLQSLIRQLRQLQSRQAIADALAGLLDAMEVACSQGFDMPLSIRDAVLRAEDVLETVAQKA